MVTLWSHCGHTVAQKDGRGQHLNNALFVLIHPKCAEKTSHVTPPPPGTTDKKQDGSTLSWCLHQSLTSPSE